MPLDFPWPLEIGCETVATYRTSVKGAYKLDQVHLQVPPILTCIVFFWTCTTNMGKNRNYVQQDLTSRPLQ